jgi:outer membrane protein
MDSLNFSRKCLFSFIFLGLAFKGFGQEKKEIIKLTINQAKTFAVQNNRAVQAARIDVTISDKKIWEVISSGLPQINFAANYQHQFTVPELSFGNYFDVNSLPSTGYLTKADIENAYLPMAPVSLGVPNNTTFDATLSQLIFSGEYIVGLQATKVLREVTANALVKTEDMTKEAVSTTYFLVLVLQENEKVLNNSLKYTEQTYSEMQKMNQQGLNEETDVDQMQISRSNIQTLLTSTVSQKEVALKLLKYQLGIAFEQPVELTDSLPGLIDEGNMQYLASPQFNVKNNIDYKIVTNKENLSLLSLKREKSKYMPTISSFYRHQEQTNRPVFNFAVKDLLGVSLNVPIVTSGMRSSRVNQAKYELEKSRLNKDNAEQGLILEYETAQSDYRTAFSNYAINNESMQLSKKVYDRTLIKYQEGISSSFELTQNISLFLTAETKFYYSVLSLLNAKAKLDRILGIN